MILPAPETLFSGAVFAGQVAKECCAAALAGVWCGVACCARVLVWFCDGMCDFWSRARNSDLNHKILVMDLVQNKKFRLEP